jgi:hypothetical protein
MCTKQRQVSLGRLLGQLTNGKYLLSLTRVISHTRETAIVIVLLGMSTKEIGAPDRIGVICQGANGM